MKQGEYHNDWSLEGRQDAMRYATPYHAPVLYKAVVEALVTDPAGIYVDATLGGGGHAQALLETLAPEGRVIGMDQDTDALEAAGQRLSARYEARFEAVHGNFGYIGSLLPARGVEQVDGILIDLGVSSYQIDTPERGFSYVAEGPLDMRMDPGRTLTADEVVNRWSEPELRRLFYEFGEEPRAPKVAREIVSRRPLHSTAELAEAVRGVVPYRDAVKTLARVFQAIRIVVNDEIAMLERALLAGLELLKTGGRMAVISYHSLEDRPVKQFFKYGNLEGEPVHDFYGNLLTPWRLVTRKPVSADPNEVAANPRARSARLRVAEKISDPVEKPHP